MNEYEERQEAKRERMRARAAKVAKEASALHDEGWKRLEAIPFGQPILVGHHSECADRSYRSRAVGKIDKSIELANKVGSIAARADAVGTGGISSDDPDAIAKLKKKLLDCQEKHAAMIDANRGARANGQPKPYLGWQLSNSTGNITSIKNRIIGLRHIRTAPAMEPKSGNGWRMFEDKEENRIVIKFDARPSVEICKSLRSYGFLWSPSRGAWVRKAINARFAVDRAYQILSAL
jgi:Domain of unknown function (DUF3560)